MVGCNQNVKMTMDILNIYQAEKYLLDLKGNANIIFRGENKKYSSLMPSLHRQSEEIYESIFSMTPNICLHIFDEKIRKYLTIEDGVPYYEKNIFGAKNELDIYEEFSVVNVTRGIEGLLQHYGLPSRWIDFTSSVETAIYFANEKNESEIGYIYYLDYSKLSSQTSIIINLSDFVNQLNKILHFEKNRAINQFAFTFNSSSISDISKMSTIKQIKFYKDENYKKVSTKSIYPSDALRIWLMGQVIDYFFDYKKRLENYISNNTVSEEDINMYNSLTKNFEKVITYLKLWD